MKKNTTLIPKAEGCKKRVIIAIIIRGIKAPRANIFQKRFDNTESTTRHIATTSTSKIMSMGGI